MTEYDELLARLDNPDYNYGHGMFPSRETVAAAIRAQAKRIAELEGERDAARLEGAKEEREACADLIDQMSFERSAITVSSFYAICRDASQRIRARPHIESQPTSAAPPSYHDLHITTDTIERTSIFNLPYRVIVTCTRLSGWQVSARRERDLPAYLIGGEYDGPGMLLDVGGVVICDSRAKPESENV